MLPEAKYTIHQLKIPSTNETINFRPFKVKEQKNLLQALEMGDTNNFVETIYSIIEACTFNKIDVRKLQMEDIDYIFLMLRAKSNGEKIKANYKCVKHNEEGEVCGKTITTQIDLSKVEVFYPIDYEDIRIVKTSETSGLKLKNPTFEAYKKLSNIENVNGLFSVAEAYLFSCIECIFDGDDIKIPLVDFSEKEFEEYVDELDSNVIDEINVFLDNLPYTGLDLEIKCPKCGNNETIRIKELEDFFV